MTHPIMCRGKVKNWGSRTSSSVKMGVSGTNIAYSGTDIIRISGVSGTRYCENTHALPKD